jgi:hypothetical protein
MAERCTVPVAGFVSAADRILRGDLDEKAATIRMGTGVAAEA